MDLFNDRHRRPGSLRGVGHQDHGGRRVRVKVIDDNPGLALRVTLFVLAFLLWFGIKVLIKNRAALLGSTCQHLFEKGGFLQAALSARSSPSLKKIDKGEIVRKITEDCAEKIGEKYIGESWVDFFARLIFWSGYSSA